ncbi:MAG: TIGR02594 family protein [Candidatus Nealsonbacteria bacterium]|nr:TIGR02594 family protein [Candidatus Nealsonbacteria bacterium]
MSTSIGGSVGSWQSGAKNNLTDIKAIQQLLKAASKKLGKPAYDPGKVDGKIHRVANKSGTVAAIVNFQRQHVKMAKPDARIDVKGRTWRALAAVSGSAAKTGVPGSDADAPWMKIAKREIGQKEMKGSKHNPRIVEYLGSTTLNEKYASKDETAWCAAFVNWVLKKAGKTKLNTAWAASWAKYGKHLDEARYGAVVLIRTTPTKSIRGTTTSGNHVGFLVEETPGSIKLLGGNQGDSVKYSTFSKGKWKVIAYRWPI